MSLDHLDIDTDMDIDAASPEAFYVTVFVYYCIVYGVFVVNII